jgi:hypothetical protein
VAAGVRRIVDGDGTDEIPPGGTAVEVHQQVPGLLRGPGSSRMARRPKDVHVAAADSRTKKTIRFRVTAQSTWKKSTASMVEDCARRTCRHVVSVDRDGAGGIRRSWRIVRIVDAPTRWPSLSSSPWIRL